MTEQQAELARRGQHDDDMNLVVEAARSAVAQEFNIAERLDAKARNQMTIAGAWYALVTAVAGVALRAQIDAGGDDWLVAAIVVFAAAAGGCLIAAMLFSYRVWRLHHEPEVAPDGLLEMTVDAQDPDVDVAEQLVQHYRALLARRRANNKKRAASFQRSVTWWTASLVFALLELLAALIALAQA
jgi:uncharacterized integral membrane protein